MRNLISSVAIETGNSKTFPAIRMLSLTLGLAAAHMMLSATLSARAETQAAIDAVTLARPHMPNDPPGQEHLDAKLALAD